MPLRQLNSSIDDSTIYHKKHKMFLTILQEPTQCLISLLFSDTTRRPVFCCKCGSHLSEREFCQQNSMLCLRVGKLSNPGTARFIGIAFNHCTGIKIVVTHDCGPRCLQMSSL